MIPFTLLVIFVWLFLPFTLFLHPIYFPGYLFITDTLFIIHITVLFTAPLNSPAKRYREASRRAQYLYEMMVQEPQLPYLVGLPCLYWFHNFLLPTKNCNTAISVGAYSSVWRTWPQIFYLPDDAILNLKCLTLTSNRTFNRYHYKNKI